MTEYTSPKTAQNSADLAPEKVLEIAPKKLKTLLLRAQGPPTDKVGNTVGTSGRQVRSSRLDFREIFLDSNEKWIVYLPQLTLKAMRVHQSYLEGKGSESSLDLVTARELLRSTGVLSKR